MQWRRAGWGIAPALLAACSPPSDGPMAVAQIEAKAVGDPALAMPPLELPRDPVPDKLLGNWVYSHEECEPDSEFSPNTSKIDASISFDAEGTYATDIEGFPITGTYRYDGGDSPRITLDSSLLNFDPVGDTLQNWSEGDAVYQCGRVFVREGQQAGGDR